MAVVQISRIQIRRGKSLEGTGLPQLASGELAWSLDTQELYIGNGSVAEGSPAVGNTKILTERDLTSQGNILNLINHTYKVNDPGIQTGPTINSPISRPLQSRLDDRVSVSDFGATGNGTTDDTVALQRAIDQLYLNPTAKASADIADGILTRTPLMLEPGIYKTTQTLYIPSYATLVGAGSNKTIISYTGTGPAIQFINDSSTIGNPSTIGNTQGNTQPRYIELTGLSVVTNTNNRVGLKLDAVRDSKFTDLIVKGNWLQVVNTASRGIELNAVSALVTCSDNIFSNITVTGFTTAVYSKQDIMNNAFVDCNLFDLRQGFVLGEGADGTTVGQQFGPRQTSIVQCKFDNIKQHAVYVDRGTGTVTRDCKLKDVGNNGAGVFYPEYPQIYFGRPGNTSQNDQSDRAVLGSDQSFTIELELSTAITASKGDIFKQLTTNVQAVLKEDVTNTRFVTVVTQYTTPFNNFSNISINNNITPGITKSIEVSASSTTAFTTTDTTGELTIGTPITFNGTAFGGVITTNTTAGFFVVGKTYTITSAGTTDFVAIGAANNDVGTRFVASDIGAGTGTARITYFVQGINDGVTFSISDSLGGPQKTLGISSGLMTASFPPTIHPFTVGDSMIVPYIPEVTGWGSYSSFGSRQKDLGYFALNILTPDVKALIGLLPVSTLSTGAAAGSVTYKVDYLYKSRQHNFSKSGTLTLVVDIDASNSGFTTISQLTDDYNVSGISDNDALKFDISAVLLNQDGSVFSGLGDVPTSIALQYVNTIIFNGDPDAGAFMYSYTSTATYLDII